MSVSRIMQVLLILQRSSTSATWSLCSTCMSLSVSTLRDHVFLRIISDLFMIWHNLLFFFLYCCDWLHILTLCTLPAHSSCLLPSFPHVLPSYILLSSPLLLPLSFFCFAVGSSLLFVFSLSLSHFISTLFSLFS